MRRDIRGNSGDWAVASVLITMMLCIFFSPAGSCSSRNEENLHTEKMKELEVRLAEAKAKSAPSTPSTTSDLTKPPAVK